MQTQLPPRKRVARSDYNSAFRIHNWMETHKSMLVDESAKDIAEAAEKDLGFPITRAQVQHFRNRMGIRIYARSSEAKEKQNPEAVRILRTGMVQLFRHCGLRVPDELSLLS